MNNLKELPAGREFFCIYGGTQGLRPCTRGYHIVYLKNSFFGGLRAEPPGPPYRSLIQC